jgi:hypothetical protein
MRRSPSVLLLVLGVLASAATAQWSTPTNLGAPLNTTASDYYPQFSYDGLILRWSNGNSTPPGGWGVYQTQRLTRHSPWGALTVEPGGIQTPSNDLSVWVFRDELTCYFTTITGTTDIHAVTRALPTDPWGAPAIIPELVGTGTDFGVTVTADGLYMLWSGARTGAGDIYESSRPTPTSPWTPPILVTNLSRTTADYGPSLSPDGLTVYLCQTGVGGPGGWDVVQSTRKLRTDPWPLPVLVANVSSVSLEREVDVSADGRELVVTSDRAGGIGGPDTWYSTFTGLSHENLPQPGQPLLIHVTNAARAGNGYVVGAALSSTPGIPVPAVGTIPLAFDALLLLSTSGALPTVFTNFAGLLDTYGEATATLNFPAVPALAGLPFSIAAVTYDMTGINWISNGEDLQINP